MTRAYLHLVGVGGHDCLSLGPDHPHPHNPKMPHQTVTELTRDSSLLRKQNEQLQHQLDEALEALDETTKAAEELKTKNKRLKRALQKG